MSGVFEHIDGNDPIKQYLTRMVEKGNIAQSLLFSGLQGSGKTLFAEAFANLVTGSEKSQHPDIHHYRPEGKIGMHSIHSMREFSQEVHFPPFEAKKKVFIIHDAHRMLPSSANALLKTFEEPSLDTIIILISHASEQLLSTVLSRCQTVRFHPISPAETTPRPLVDSFLKILSHGYLSSYTNIVQYSKEVSDKINASLKEQETDLRSHLLEGFSDKPTAAQRQSMEKEVEGFLSLQKIAEAQTLFYAMLSWYRDLQLLYVNGDKNLLVNASYEEELVQFLQRGNILPIERVQTAISDALLALNRSTSLEICLESLFVKLFIPSGG